MGILTILGGIFSSMKIYLILGAIALVGVAVGYVFYLKSDAANARAALATSLATVNEQDAVLKSNQNTINEMQKERAADEAALRGVATASANVADKLSQINGAINAIPVPKTCQALDPRDRAAVDGVRRLLNPAPAAHSNTDH